MAKSKKSPDRGAKDKAEQGVSALLYEALEAELGGVEVYLAALECVLDPELRSEWEKYLAQTREHVETVEKLLKARGLDPSRDTPGRQVVRLVGKSLVKAMQLAHGSVPPDAAEIVAAECVVLAETKDHSNWSVIKKIVEQGADAGKDLAQACEQVEKEEDEHLYHTQGWVRELRKQALGIPAELPPPEEEQDVESAEEAAKARKAGK